MLDPFLDYSTHKLDKEADAINEEWVAQYYGHPLKDTNTPSRLAQWIGNLMIRIGQKLAKEDSITSNAKRIA